MLHWVKKIVAGVAKAFNVESDKKFERNRAIIIFTQSGSREKDENEE